MRRVGSNGLTSQPVAPALRPACFIWSLDSVVRMVGMIAAARQFEQQMRLLQTAESDDKSAGQLLSLNG